jgi:hypothetical protein
MSVSFLAAAAARNADGRASARPRVGALPLAAESAAEAAARGMREAATFSYRGVSVSYSELPDAESNLLFGNVCWPAAETLARLLIDEAKGGAKVWTAAASMQLGVPLEMLLRKRFGGIPVAPPPQPSALERLRLATVLPDLSADTVAASSSAVSSGRCRVLEVGAGVGVCGLACHALGAAVLITDGEQRLVEHNITYHANQLAQVGNLPQVGKLEEGGEARLRFGHLDWCDHVLPSPALDPDDVPF